MTSELSQQENALTAHEFHYLLVARPMLCLIKPKSLCDGAKSRSRQTYRHTTARRKFKHNSVRGHSNVS